jgi:CBS domain-containing protein
MSAPVETVGPDVSLAEAGSLMRGLRLHHLVVKDAGKIVGVLASSDLPDVASNGRGEPSVSDVMSPHVATVDQNETVRRAANVMRGRQVGCLVVMNKNRLAGIVTISDLLDLLGKGVERRGSGPRASLHYRTQHSKQHGRQRW